MKKTIKYFNVISAMILLVMSIFVLVACKPKKPTPQEEPPKPEVVQVKLDAKLSEENIFLRDTATLSVSVTPASVNQSYKVELSDQNLATYSDGVITGLAQGTITITVTSNADSSVKETLSLTIMPDLVEEKFDAEYIATAHGENASTSAMVKYQTHNKNTSVEYTLASDPEFLNKTVLKGSCYYFCEQHEDLDGPFSERYIYRTYLNNLTPDTKYIYRINKGDDTYSETYQFKTAKGSGDTTFLYLTDTHYWVQSDGTSHGSEISEETIKNIVSRHPEITMVVDSGDTIDTGGNDRIWNVMYKHRESLKTLAYASVPGNHEYYVNGTGMMDNRFFKAMSPSLMNGPEEINKGSSYYFVYNDVLFLMLDNVKATNYNQHFAWMENVLRNNKSKYIVVNYHIPTHEGGTDQDSKYNALFQKYGVDLVLSGHYHTEDYDFIYNDEDINKGDAGVHFFRGGSSGVKGGTPVGYAITITEEGHISIKRYSTQGILEKTYELDTIKYKEPGNGELSVEVTEFLEENKAVISWGEEAYGHYEKVEVRELLRGDFNYEIFIHSKGYKEVEVPLQRLGYDSLFEIVFTDLNGVKSTYLKSITTNEAALSVTPSSTSATLNITPSATPMFDFLMASYDIYVNGNKVASNVPYSQTTYTLNNLSKNTKYKVEVRVIDYDDKVAYTLATDFQTK